MRDHSIIRNVRTSRRQLAVMSVLLALISFAGNFPQAAPSSHPNIASGPRQRGLPRGIGVAPITPVEHWVVDPTDHRVVYASTEVDGIYKTRDGGQIWTAANRGLPVPAPYRTSAPLLAIHPEQPRVLYTLIAHPVHSHNIEHKLYRSTDGGEHWQYLAHLSRDFTPRALSAQAIDAQEVELVVEHDQGALTWTDNLAESPDVTHSETAPEETNHQPPATNNASAFPDFDAGQIAVVHDDGTLFHVPDLDGKTIQFEPAGPLSFTVAMVPFAFGADLGQRLTLGDDDSVAITLPFEFRFYRSRTRRVFVNSNGNLTLGSGSNNPSPDAFSFNPRISGFWTDLDPGRGGGVFARLTSNLAVFTWAGVPERGKNNSNTFQVEVRSDGRVFIHLHQVPAQTGLTGISNALVAFPTLVDFTDDLPLPSAHVRTAILEIFDGSINTHLVARRFYQHHPDNYDFVTVFAGSTTPFDVAGGAFAFYQPVRNDVEGIGFSVGTFNGGPAAFGSPGRLQGVINMNRLGRYPEEPAQSFLRTNSTLDVLAQEVGHRWLAFVLFDDGGKPSHRLLGRSLVHWSFFHNTFASEAEGNLWVDNGNGTFTSLEATTRYSPLDLYLIGLASRFEVPPFFFINEDPATPNGKSASSPPEPGVTVKGTRQTVTLAQVIRVEGARSPSFPFAPRSFNQAFLLVVPEGETASATDLAKLDTIRRAWEIFFSIITNGRGRINTSLRGDR